MRLVSFKFAALLVVLAGDINAQTNIVYDIHKRYDTNTSFHYPGDDGKPIKAMVRQGFLVPHDEAPKLKRGSYQGLCWGALPTEWVINNSSGILVIPSGEPLAKCWKFAPKNVQTARTDR